MAHTKVAMYTPGEVCHVAKIIIIMFIYFSVGQELIGMNVIMLLLILTMELKLKTNCLNTAFCHGKNTKQHCQTQLALLWKISFQQEDNNTCYRTISSPLHS